MVVGVEEGAGFHGEAAAADAAGELLLEFFDAAAALFEGCFPAEGSFFPIGLGRRFCQRDFGEGVLDILEWDAEAFGDADQGHAADHVARVAALVAGSAIGGDEAEALVIVERGDGGARALAHLPHAEKFLCVR